MAKRRPIYSRSNRPAASQLRTGAGDRGQSDPDAVFLDPFAEDEGPSFSRRAGELATRVYRRHQSKFLILASALVTLLLVGAVEVMRPPGQNLTQTDLNAAVNFALDERPRPPADTALAYAQIIRSVVRVTHADEPDPELDETPATEEEPDPDFHEDLAAIGTGVIVDEDGAILTNLHVVEGARTLVVRYADGTESEAFVVRFDTSNDLAVLLPRVLPDDMVPATLAGTGDLNVGDPVMAVGFPFGIGPSASAGVVSGLGRAFAQEDDLVLQNLIQFDAAANPGNSGGPLINMNGEVVGLVTAILNPSGIRTFAGIGFAITIEEAAGVAGESPF